MSTTTERVAVMDLLAEFERKPGCERYSGDGERIAMLTLYLFVRQLTPNLPFEEFLARYEGFADFDDENCKRPEDAVKKFCPRRMKVKVEGGPPQWTAEQARQMTVLYIDMVREAEAQNEEPPLTYREWLEKCGAMFLAGEIPPPAEAAPRRAGRKPKANEPVGTLPQPGPQPQSTLPAVGEPVAAAPATPTAPTPPTATQAPAAKSRRTAAATIAANEPDRLAVEAATGVIEHPVEPTAVGQRVIYTHPVAQGRQIKGQVVGLQTVEDRRYADILGDDGELFAGTNATHCAVIVEQPPTPPLATERVTYFITNAAYPTIANLLSLSQPAGNAEIAKTMYVFNVPFAHADGKYVMDLAVVNGETGPYVDALLADGRENKVVFELPPRKNLLGEYRCEASPGVWLVAEVRIKG